MSRCRAVECPLMARRLAVPKVADHPQNHPHSYAGKRQKSHLSYGFRMTFPTASRRSSIARSEEHTSELQSLMRISYAVFCLKNKTKITTENRHYTNPHITH